MYVTQESYNLIPHDKHIKVVVYNFAPMAKAVREAMQGEYPSLQDFQIRIAHSDDAQEPFTGKLAVVKNIKGELRLLYEPLSDSTFKLVGRLDLIE